MKIGDLVRHKDTGDIGIIISLLGRRRFVKIQWVKGGRPWNVPRSNLEVINESE
jgi:hypothetical protein